MGVHCTRGEPNEIELAAAHRLFYRSLAGTSSRTAGVPGTRPGPFNIAPMGPNGPQWGSIRSRPLICTYTPWGVRVAELAKPRKTPARKHLPLHVVNRYGMQGYIEMARNTANATGICGIAMQASHALGRHCTSVLGWYLSTANAAGACGIAMQASYALPCCTMPALVSIIARTGLGHQDKPSAVFGWANTGVPLTSNPGHLRHRHAGELPYQDQGQLHQRSGPLIPFDSLDFATFERSFVASPRMLHSSTTRAVSL